MEEAERLCDRLVVIDNGTVVAQGSPSELIENTPGAASLEDVFVHVTNSVNTAAFEGAFL
jgi:ABC-type multidrug transport system ATPase subunit